MSRVAKGEKKSTYQHGYSDGYRLGMCQSVLQKLPPPDVNRRDLKVMFVPQGFEAIDSGVISALQQLVSSCIVAEASTIVEQAQQHQPDVLIVLNGLHVFPEEHLAHIRQIRSMGIKTVIWFADDPYFTEDTILMCKEYDVVFTHEQSCVPFYIEAGAAQVHYLPLGVNPHMFFPQKHDPQHCYDICFIGNAFWNRVTLFDEMAQFLSDKKVLIAGGFWERLSRQDLLQKFIQPGFIAPEETAKYYNGSKVVINIHRPTEKGQDNRNYYELPGQSINPRTYEISACGAMQITDVRDDLSTHFTPGVDIETFSSVEELKRKITYYLKHPEERARMAARGLWTTREKHSFVTRIEALLAHL